ncbi:MAG: hypothetical protein LJE97_19165 [Betaproteobacteria bacterium]|jgi:hypothetical protein|nr:hypothetical protein [Betaproteobacteria bacterium]
MATKRKVVRRAPGSARGKPPARERRPDVILDVDCENALLFLVLRNIGDDLACRVSVKFSPELVGLGGERVVSDATIFRRLAYLPPGKSIRVFLDAAPLLFSRRKENSFRARVQYRNRSGNEFSETFTHDLDVYRDLPEAAGASIRARAPAA